MFGCAYFEIHGGVYEPSLIPRSRKSVARRRYGFHGASIIESDEFNGEGKKSRRVQEMTKTRSKKLIGPFTPTLSMTF